MSTAPLSTVPSSTAPFGSLLGAAPVRVAAAGVPAFAEVPRGAGAEVAALDWRPPAAGDPELAWRLARITAHARVEAANAEAVSRLLAVRPVWRDVLPAREALPVLDDRASGRRLLLHAGPPIAWDRMCGPMRAGVVGAALLEGWAGTAEEAERLAATGELEFEPCHHHEAVGPMGGIISPSMPLLVVEDPATGRRAYSNLNEGAGRCLRYGALGDDVMDRLRWMGGTLGPALRTALRALPDGVDLRAVTAQALQMGDECHSRNTAASVLLLRELAAPLARTPDGPEVLDFLADNHYWFLNFSMAAAKLATSAAAGVPHSTLVTAFARNGVEVGIRVSGLGDAWFTAPATRIRGMYFAGYGPEDANPDIGDSAITETYGLGGFSLAAAPAITGFVGGTVAEALRISRDMARITLARHEAYRLPMLGGVGSPVGIDLRAVLDTGIVPVVTTGISHREAGIGQIGAGLTHAPLECFRKALEAFPVPEFTDSDSTDSDFMDASGADPAGVTAAGA
ncbi:DUF1116 domain-containing protein [Streptomyces boluensis]|uniref:DUF1116 domain-containing protein n=1 Tax=Streptomyces boluensis TaxID=1775135 RepID=A0A964UVL2_9ACTN|nr:DUF1116 domain-containing protein [Streptomyces boluensis]NBE55542.1 DUF1116 domain-containing protein [Streptomyces boluensis]